MSIDKKSSIDVKSRMSRNEARKALSRLLKLSSNLIGYTKHCKKRLVERNLRIGDIINVLHRGKILEEPEKDNGHWKYRVSTNNITVVIAFRGANSITVITTWRNK